MYEQQSVFVPENLISIGEFAKETELSIKALRLYHDKGLLEPAHIDPFTNYRYYASEQVPTANYIRLLREMDMPLTMIEQFLKRFESEPRKAAAVMQTYLQLFEARIALIHQTAEKVSSLLDEQEQQMEMQQEREICLYDLPIVDNQRLLDVLGKVMDAIQRVLTADHYRLVGTTASILHGAQTPSKGVDFLMRDRDSVDAFHLALSTFKIDAPPTYLPDDQQYWASYFVDGVHVNVTTTEWAPEGDAVESSGEGPWKHFSQLPVGQHSVPTVDLELRLVSELFRDRPDRYEPLIDFMRTRKVNLELLQHSMTQRQIPSQQQADVIDQLTA